MSALDTQVGGDHYKNLKIQPMEYSMANKLDACQHTAIKYITRFRDKGGIADLEKAKHCIDMLIEFERQVIADGIGIPKDFVPYKYGDSGPSVGTIVDVIYVSNEVEQNKIIGQFSWSGVKGYKVRLATPAPMPSIPVAHVGGFKASPRWEVGTRLRLNGPSSEFFTEGNEYEIQSMQADGFSLIDDQGREHAWTVSAAMGRFVRA